MNAETRFSTAALDQLANTLESLLSGENAAALLGPDLSKLAARIPSSEQVTPGAIVRLALLNDALCVAERAIREDGTISDAEVAYVEPLVRETHKYLSRVRSFYRDTVDLEAHGVRHFIDHHVNDTQQFGGKCRGTAWLGLSVCQRASRAASDHHYVEQYRDVLSRTVDELFDSVGSGTRDHKQGVLAELDRMIPSAQPSRDPREIAYCSPESAEVFHAIAHTADVFTIDTFDVETIHAEARLAFNRLVDRAAEARFGKMLLIKGEAGSGKTHLMRAFRNQVHGEHLGFVGYLQMSTRVTNYARYILSNLIESWDRGYWGDASPDPAITYLSDAVSAALSAAERDRLRDTSLSESELHEVVNRSADELLATPAYEKANVDLLRMMLYLQRREPARRARVLKFLRCEAMNAHDRAFVGDGVPFEGEEGPARMLSELGRLVWLTKGGALVLLVDQLEDVYHLEDAAHRFRLAMDALRHITDHVPTSVVVIACLEDFYKELRGALASPMLERLEKDPEPIRLTAGRSLDEIEELIGRRLHYLFEQKGTLVREDDPLYPFKPHDLAARVNQRTRDILDWCRTHHNACIDAGSIVEPAVAPAIAPAPTEDAQRMGELSLGWNDARVSSAAPPEDELARLQLLRWALESVAREHEGSPAIETKTDGGYLEVKLPKSDITVGLCEKTARGGALGGQIEALTGRARQRRSIPVALRSSEYPPPGKTRIAQQLKELLQAGGRRVVVTDSDWRFIAALRDFCEARRQHPQLGPWLREEQPLSGLTSLRAVLNLEAVPLRTSKPPTGSATAPPTPAASPNVPPVPTAARPSSPAAVDSLTTAGARPQSAAAASFSIGETRGLAPHPVLAAADAFATHAAFLGSTKSGKTTLALGIIENLLAQGVPALMIDRKGDLCTYAQREFWESPAADAPASELKRLLRDRIDVCVFTPGEPRGRSLTLPVIPQGISELPTHERGIAARYAASALGAMMGYRKSSKTDETRLGILGKAIELIGCAATQPRGPALGIPQLVVALHEEDPELVSLVGKLDTKHFRALVENLETLRLRYEHLLREDGEALSPELLFGLDSRRNSTRLSIVSTKFLGDNAAIDFWVSRLLGELSRWASRSPSSSLQGVVFLDEADIYLPAQTKPATKEPMLDLLKRARSAGLGVFLATQSPGDLDYRCRDNIRTWFVGRVAEKTAVDKMKPLLSECRVNVSAKLANAKVGEFFKLQDGDAIEFKAQQSLMRTSQLGEDEIVKLASSSKR